jgi:malonyl CoA-acyl carrier protein transacylase
MKTFMFPGQGSQARGMGGELFDEFPELTKKADKILGYSIKELCHNDPKRELSKTQFTQPALYVVNALSYFKKIEVDGKKPDFVIGHSLGEFNALLAADCFDFEAGLKLVKKRGELMSQATNGGMAAILNGSKQDIESILIKNELTNIDLANFNTPSQIVISGPTEDIGKAQSFFQDGELLYYPLNTSGAFHSRYMKPSKDKFLNYLGRFKLADIQIPVVSNVTAKPYLNQEIKENISNQISSAVRWSESVQYLIKVGEDESEPMEFEEVGHGDVLTKLVGKIKEETAEAATNNSASKESAEKPLKQVKAKKETSVKASSKDVENSLVKPTNNNNSLVNDADGLVNNWNVKHPIGTKVKSLTSDYDELETRTEAVVLFGHRAAVYMKDYNGYFDLNEIQPI